MPPVLPLAVLACSLIAVQAVADDAKSRALTAVVPAASRSQTLARWGASDGPVGGAGYRIEVTNGPVRIPVVVVGGSPYQMGWHFGRLMQEEIRRFIPPTLEGFRKELGVDAAQLDDIWTTTAGFTDDRVEQELLGVAHGSGLPVQLLHHAHVLPLLMPYSCSSIAAWGSATRDGHLYQTRNLDWSMKAGAHEFPVLLVRLPETGRPHVTPTFAGFVGAHCGMNTAGIVLSEMGDASAKEAPYDVQAPHFTAWFRTLLYDAGSLDDAMAIFQRQPQTKRYHFVFGDGRTARRAVKIRTDTRASRSPEVKVWKDNDTTDELAPEVLSCVVYQDEGRGAFPALRSGRGSLDGPALIAVANSIPIKGGNVMNAVFDGTGLRMWASYAHGTQEAYQRPYVFLDLTTLDRDGDGRSDIDEGGVDRDGDGTLDFMQGPAGSSGKVNR